MEVTKEQKDAAFKAAEKNDIKGVLIAIFGISEKPKDNRPVTERIKTFEDAVRELGNDHPLVSLYNVLSNSTVKYDSDVLAYLKLRIIVAALNEGWEPQFIEGERRWAPWFVLYTNAELNKMNDKDREKVCRVVGRSNSYSIAYGGLVFAVAYSASSDSSTDLGSRLAFKSEKLAEYAGQQFIEIYRDFMIQLHE